MASVVNGNHIKKKKTVLAHSNKHTLVNVCAQLKSVADFGKSTVPASQL